MKHLFLLLLIITTITVYSAESRLFQFIGDNQNESFLSLEAGTSPGISLISKNMQVSFLYSLFLVKGISISTDIFLLNNKLSDLLKIKVGLGGGIIFKPELNNLESNLLLRLPINIEVDNIFISCIPMGGRTMFEYESSWVWSVSALIGYKIDLYKEPNKEVTR